MSSGRRRVALNAGVIGDILAATRAMPFWKTCQMEGTSWTVTAEEIMSLLLVWKIIDRLDFYLCGPGRGRR